MKKIMCAVLAACTIGLSFTACSAKKSETTQVVKDPTCNFYFECPKEWEVTHTNGMLSAINPNDVSKANVTAFSFKIDKEHYGTSAVKYWEQEYKKQLSDTFGEVTVKKVEERDFGGEKVAFAKYNTAIGKEIFYCETLLVLYDNNAYVLTLTQGEKTEENEEQYNSHSDEFAEIIKTFKIK